MVSSRKLSSSVLCSAALALAAAVSGQTEGRQWYATDGSKLGKGQPAAFDEATLMVTVSDGIDERELSVEDLSIVDQGYVLSGFSASSEYHTHLWYWTSANGRHKLTAAPLAVTDESVVLRYTNGNVKRVPIAKLDAQSQEQAENLREVSARIVALARLSAAHESVERTELTGKVIGVSDGDTISVFADSRPVKVRLDGIDCPEIGQPFGKNAKSFASEFCFGGVASVQSTGEDKYGRTIGDVFVNGKHLNAELVAAGWAWHYEKYSDDPKLAKLETEARKAKRGLWADENRVAPWEWRKLSKREKAAAVAGRSAPAIPLPLLDDSPGRPSAAPTLTHWLNTSSGVRHNQSCRWYGATKGGRKCTADEGRACGQCGG